MFSVSDLATLPDGGLAGTSGAIWFSMGCHAGLNVSDVVAGKELGADWPQALAGRQRVVFLANTGFGLGDSTGAVAYSVRLMTLFASRLDGTASIGQAWVDSVREYYATLGRVSVADEKSIAEATLYGLPFYEIDHPPAAVRHFSRGDVDPGAGTASSVPVASEAAGRSARRPRLAALQPPADVDARGDAERELLRRRRRRGRRPRTSP